MNPLTLVKRIQNINSKEATLGISDDASWHVKYRDSAYVFVGGIPFDLSEGDLLAIFAQYGEIVDVNLVRDKATGKSKGFAFIAYLDQRSTNLAVDFLNGARVLGRVIRVDHVSDYKRKEEVDEAEEEQRRRERGVCRAFQKGECHRGATCKFSHDNPHAANTSFNAEDKKQTWVRDKFDDSATKKLRLKAVNGVSELKTDIKDSANTGTQREVEQNLREHYERRRDKSRKYETDLSPKKERYGRGRDRDSSSYHRR